MSDEETSSLNLEYDDVPCDNGVFDGVELAEQLINDAYKLLVPYAEACPACSDHLFTAVANEVLENIHGEAKEKDNNSILALYQVENEEEKKCAMEKHLERHQARTAQLLELGRAIFGEDDHSH